MPSRPALRRPLLVGAAALAAAAMSACGTRLHDSAFQAQTVTQSTAASQAAPGAVQPGGSTDTTATQAPGAVTNTGLPGAITPTQGPGGGVLPTSGTVTSAPPGSHTSTTPGGPQPSGGTTSSVPAGKNTASDRGVTPTSITVGNIVTTGGPFGPDEFSANVWGAKAYFADLNAHGGINGRQINFVPCQDTSGTLDGVSSCVHQLIDQSKIFAFVANNVFQYGGADYVNSQNVPDVGGEQIDLAYLQYPALFTILGDSAPRDGKHQGDNGVGYGSDELALWYKQNLGVTKVGIVFYDQASSRYGANQFVQNFTVAGVPAKTYVVNLGLPNFASTVAQMKNDGVDIVMDALDLNGNQKLCQAMESDSSFMKTVKAKVSTISTWTQSVGSAFANTPNCLAKIYSGGKSANYADTSNPEVARFRAAMKKYFPTREPKMAQWTLEGWAAADWFTSAAKSCGANLTRVCVEKWLNTPNQDLTAHGLLSPDVTFTPKTKAQMTGQEHECLSVVQWDTGSGTWATKAAPANTCFESQGYAYNLQ
ncbi:MAG TPA: ABC transporter substrate-binding protein [Mycobacteriales bacterium]|nr:ABC transporter substrate-binding protein [Mycobacteriales bacterium]